MGRTGRRYEPKLRLRDVPRIRQVAYHEAGHAVAGYELHVPFHYVTIVPDAERGSEGHVRFVGVGKDLDQARYLMTESQLRRRIEPDIICALAGEAAESRLTGRRDLLSATSDYRSAVESAIEMSGSAVEAGAYCTWLYYRAVGIVRNPFVWAAIEALAAALMDRKRIGSREARRIIKEAIQGVFETD